jgi:hypothetical protein
VDGRQWELLQLGDGKRLKTLVLKCYRGVGTVRAIVNTVMNILISLKAGIS